jgi:hypothetical protein
MGTSSSKEGSSLGLSPLQFNGLEFDRRPSSLVQCLDSKGNLQALPYTQYCQRRDEEHDSLGEFLSTLIRDDAAEESAELESTPKKRARKEPIVEYEDKNGVRSSCPPTKSNWYYQYVHGN